MVDPTSLSPSLSPPPVPAESNSPPLWFLFICSFLLLFALFYLYDKAANGTWSEVSPSHQQPQRSAGDGPEPAPLARVVVQPRNNVNVLDSFTYKGDYINQCGVCLFLFEEGLQVKQIPTCKHCFHARCINTWLSEHVDCPLCRTLVALTVVRPQK